MAHKIRLGSIKKKKRQAASAPRLEFPFMIEHDGALLRVDRPMVTLNGKYSTLYTAILRTANFYRSVVLKSDITTADRARALLIKWYDEKVPKKLLGHTPRSLFVKKETEIDDEAPF